MVTGTTSSKLSQVSTYDLANPYKIGVKGVTNVEEIDGFLTVKYNINGIEYVSEFKLNDPNKKVDVNLGLLGNETKGLSNSLKPINKSKLMVRNGSTKTTTNNISITKFKSFLSGFDFIPYPTIKEEEKLGQVFPPEIKDEIFIERTSSNIYERHSRLEDINNMEQLENYKNGFYNIFKQ